MANPTCILLFIGVDWERKGGTLALEAARILNQRGIDTVLKVVGCDAPNEPFVQRFGFISKQTAQGQHQLQELLRTATFFIFPTRAEAAGIVLCEASAFGLPVITTLTGGVESYVRNGETGFCLSPAANAVDYADLIEKTLRSPDIYRQLSLTAFANYQTTLNWDSAVTQLLALVRKTGRENPPIVEV
jgi:glycosyltransferase involved in cell wall biosynthesis